MNAIRVFDALRLMLLGIAVVAVFLGTAHAQGQAPDTAEIGRKVALVVGNSAYTEVERLDNPVHDADLIAKALDALGFEVLLYKDLDRQSFIRALTDLRASVEGAETATFFYAGHGVQVDGQNFLLPIDSALQSSDFLSLEAINLQLITDILNGASRTSLIFLDACRNNPFEVARGSNGGSRGLAKISADRNTLISFAAAPGDIALDSVPGLDTRNSPFTTALVRHLGVPGDTINRTMIKVRRDVLDMTDGRQVPWENSSLVEEVVLAALPETARPDTSGEDEIWAWAREATDPDVLERFVTRFPDGKYAEEARARARAMRLQVETGLADSERRADLSRQKEREEEERRLAFYVAPKLPELRGDLQDCHDCPELVVIEGTELLFGTPDTIARAQQDERPARRVALARSIAVARTETSQGEFGRFVKETGYDWQNDCMITSQDDRPPRQGRMADVPNDPDLPAICVSWQDATAYTRWLSEKTGQIYRLPTEIEFEYLVEAFHFNQDINGIFGETPLCDRVNIADLSTAFSWRNFECSDALGPGVFPVRSLVPNEFGLYHVLGNVWEWMENCYADSPEAAVDRALRIVGVLDECQRRAVRGGGWSDPLSSLRTSNRNWEEPDFRADTIGFRVVRLP